MENFQVTSFKSSSANFLTSFHSTRSVLHQVAVEFFRFKGGFKRYQHLGTSNGIRKQTPESDFEKRVSMSNAFKKKEMTCSDMEKIRATTQLKNMVKLDHLTELCFELQILKKHKHLENHHTKKNTGLQ